MQQHDWSSANPKGPKSHLLYLPTLAPYPLGHDRPSNPLTFYLLLSFLNFAHFPLTSHCLARICSEHNV